MGLREKINLFSLNRLGIPSNQSNHNKLRNGLTLPIHLPLSLELASFCHYNRVQLRARSVVPKYTRIHSTLSKSI
jgi:hypothetical protein